MYMHRLMTDKADAGPLLNIPTKYMYYIIGIHYQAAPDACEVSTSNIPERIQHCGRDVSLLFTSFPSAQSPMMELAFVLATNAILLLVFLVHSVRKHLRTQKLEREFAALRGCEPLRPWSARWPLGLDLLMRVSRKARDDKVLSMFIEVVNESGSTFEQSLLGVKGIDTMDPENIEAILSTDFSNYTLGLRPIHFKPLLGSGIFTQDGTPWKQSRQLLRPQLASNRLGNFKHIQACVEDLVTKLSHDVVDLQPLFFRLTFDTTMFLLFGNAVESMDWGDVAGQQTQFAAAFNSGQDYLASRGRLGDLYWLVNDKAFREACKTCHRFVDQAVTMALQEKNCTIEENEQPDSCFIESLVRQTRDPLVLRDQCLNVLLAGRDTTGCCLSWSFRLLARHPRVLNKLRAEVEAHAGSGPGAEWPSREMLKKMSYLSLVLKEVLRLYPSVPINSRSAVRTTTLPVGGGPDGRSPILVRPGQAVGYCPYVMHRRKDLYGDDADSFRPERWEGDGLKNIGWGYLPFNGGPRTCLGQEFALLEVSYTIARLVQIFPIIKPAGGEESVKAGDERQTLTLVVSCAEGCKVLLSRE